ncbi:phage regulatory CII family protein [Massilia sp. YIM B02769]|jgi:hypothetical protein|uniref:phage regulatory CII family protein n=1 Tax=Massilia sp. YIM B02769 TaxID=3050129 RepID=UPI0025B68FB7|nr:phage regulatory CII family protein [Massilia sp. YIM B02769]MDN4057142.1 phage regulatory CII family protein [Massilia sp. YIM B02769]
MNLLDAFYQTVHGAVGGCEALAVRLGMSAQVLRNKANVHSTTNKPTFEEADRICGITGDHRMVHAFAQNHGYVCVRIEDGAEASDMALLEMVAKVWQTNGEVGAEINQALADGKVDRAEVIRVRNAVKRAERALEGIVARFEGMADN